MKKIGSEEWRWSRHWRKKGGTCGGGEYVGGGRKVRVEVENMLEEEGRYVWRWSRRWRRKI